MTTSSNIVLMMLNWWRETAMRSCGSGKFEDPQRSQRSLCSGVMSQKITLTMAFRRCPRQTWRHRRHGCRVQGRSQSMLVCHLATLMMPRGRHARRRGKSFTGRSSSRRFTGDFTGHMVKIGSDSLIDDSRSDLRTWKGNEHPDRSGLALFARASSGVRL